MRIVLTNFFLNGQKYRIDIDSTIQDILKYFNYRTNVFVIEYNSTISDKNEWKNLKIKNNDIIEIITIVGGG